MSEEIEKIEEKKRVDTEELRRYGFSEDVIEEAVLREKQGLLDIKPSSDLRERVIALAMEAIKKQSTK